MPPSPVHPILSVDRLNNILTLLLEHRSVEYTVLLGIICEENQWLAPLHAELFHGPYRKVNRLELSAPTLD